MVGCSYSHIVLVNHFSGSHVSIFRGICEQNGRTVEPCICVYAILEQYTPGEVLIFMTGNQTWCMHYTHTDQQIRIYR